MAKETGYVHWTSDDYRAVARKAVKHVDAGVHPTQAFFLAQTEALPLSGRRNFEQVKQAARGGNYTRHLELARLDLTIEEAEGRPDAPGGEPLKPPRYTSPRIFWTMTEWRLLAREVEKMKNDKRAVGYRIFDAQAKVLPVERRRNAREIVKGFAPSSQGWQRYAEAAKTIWMLDMVDRHKAADSSVVAPAAVAAVVAAVESASEPAPTPLPDTTPAPVAPVLEMVSRTQSPALAPQALPAPFDVASQAFVQTFSGALSTLLAAHAQHVMGRVDELIGTAVGKVADGIAEVVRTQLHSGVRDAVIQTLNAELGGPAAAPAPTPEAVVTPAATTEVVKPTAPEVAASRPKAIPVDVVGLSPSNIHTIKARLSDVFDLRCFDVNHQEQFRPRADAEVFVSRRYVAHSVTDRIRAHGKHPHIITGSAGAMIHAIEEFGRSARAEAVH